jgi:hypothetical protein
MAQSNSLVDPGSVRLPLSSDRDILLVAAGVASKPLWYGYAVLFVAAQYLTLHLTRIPSVLDLA